MYDMYDEMKLFYKYLETKLKYNSLDQQKDNRIKFETS